MRLPFLLFRLGRRVRYYGRIREELTPIIDLKGILADEAYHVKNCLDRHSPASMSRLSTLYSQYCQVTKELNSQRQLRKKLAADFLKASEVGQALCAVDDAHFIKERLERLEGQLRELTAQMDEEISSLPNRTHPSSPIGGPEDNQVVETFGRKPKISADPIDHVAISTRLGIVDFEAGARTSGSSFYFLKGQGALLENALIQYALKMAMEAGFTPIIPPDIVNSKFIRACGFQPRNNDPSTSPTPVYCAEVDGEQDLPSPLKVLAATGEIPLAAYHSGQILKASELPIKWVAISHCFRPETGHHGTESRGLYRVHQFSKVELFIIKNDDPQSSDAALKEIVALQKKIISGFDLHCRLLNMSSAELGASAYQKYDIEAYFPGRLGWGELTSASNCTDYQSRRLGLRYRDAEGKMHFTHTLNGTACAIPRVIQAIIENHQQSDGSITIPEAIRPYMLDKSSHISTK